MVCINSAQEYNLYKTEAVFKVAEIPNASLGIITNVSPSENNNLIEDPALGERENVGLRYGTYDVTLPLEGSLNSGAIFKLFFGQSIDTDELGEDYKHVFMDGSNPLTSIIPSFTFQTNMNSIIDYVKTYSGCVVNTISLSAAINEVIKVSSEVIGSRVVKSGTLGTKVTNYSKSLIYSDFDVAIGDVASEVTEFTRDFSLELGNNYDAGEGKVNGERENVCLHPKNFTLAGSFTKFFSEDVQYTRFLGGASPTTAEPVLTSMIIQANNGITIGSGRREFYLELEGHYGEASEAITTGALIEQTFSFTSLHIKECYFVDQVASY